jgi:hypothetical protein
MSFLWQPTHFVTWVDPDIFDGITWVHRNKRCFVAYDKLFLQKISEDPLLPIEVPYGESYSSAVVKKV